MRFQEASDAIEVYFLPNFCSGDRSNYIYQKLKRKVSHRSLELHFSTRANRLILPTVVPTVAYSFAYSGAYSATVGETVGNCRQNCRQILTGFQKS